MKQEEQKPKIDYSKLDENQRSKLEQWQQNHDQLKTLNDIADIVQDINVIVSGQGESGEKTDKEMGACLMDIRDSLNTIKDKAPEEKEDFASPVIKAVDKLQIAVVKALNSIDVKPNITVDAPKVNITPPSVDLKGIEKVLKSDIPKAFSDCMKSMPKMEKPDNSEMLKAWEGISQQLQSIENATRMKPIPGSMVVSNLPITNGKVDVNATVTATVDPAGLATDTIQTNGTQKTQIVDAGGDAVTVTGGKLDVNVTIPPVTIDPTGLATDTLQTAGNGSLATIAGKDFATQTTLALIKAKTDNIPALGQALAAASVPVILPTATITTLTPPAAITGFATEAKQLPNNHNVVVTSMPAVSIDTTGLATSAKQLPDGHTVALSATDNAVLDAIEVDTTTLAGGVSGGHYQVDVLTMPAGGSSLTDAELRATAVPISGTITANAGTNLNTSALATSAKQLADNHQVTISNIASTPVITGFATETTLGTVHGHVDSIDTKTPALGQALAAASVPVILPAATVTTLTPPAAISGFATSAKQLADGHSVALSATDNAVLDAIDSNTDSGAVVGVGAAATAQRVHLADESLSALENITVTSSGTVTANAGTNLNTSALALESGGNLASIKTNTDKIPALGQALAAASVPVILPAATVTTLTPPAAITGFATSANQLPAGHEVEVNNFPTEYPLSAAQVSTLTPPAAITGFATSAKQLADNHQVTVSNLASTPLVDITTLATSAKQLPDGHTVALSATDNAVLDAIEVDTTTLAGGVAGGHYQVDVLTMPAGGSSLTDTELRATAVPVSLASVPSHAVTFTGSTDVATQTTLAAINTKLVTGTVIGDVNLGATDNAVLDTIAAKDFATQTTLAALNAKMVTGTDIGDVTINNSTGASAVNIQDGGNTITVDGAVTNTVLSVVGTGTEATAQRVTIASDSTGVLSIDDNGGAITVDGTVTANLSATDNAVLDTIDADTSILAAGVSGGHYQVDVLTAPSTAVTNAGTFAVQTTSAITGISQGFKVVTTAGTDVVLAASTTCKRVIIQAQTDNTSIIAVGGSGVDATIATGTGIILNPGDAFEMEIDNLTDVYIDSLVSGEGCRFTYWT